jgi:hypothetical protein
LRRARRCAIVIEEPMAERARERRGGGSRALVFLVLVALVVLAIAYLRDCVPGLGTGDRSPAAEAPASPAPETSTAGEGPLELTVEADRCRRGSEPPEPCDELCRALAAEPKNRKIVVHATLGTHSAVDALRRCLADQGLRDVVVRTD